MISGPSHTRLTYPYVAAHVMPANCCKSEQVSCEHYPSPTGPASTGLEYLQYIQQGCTCYFISDLFHGHLSRHSWILRKGFCCADLGVPCCPRSVWVRFCHIITPGFANQFPVKSTSQLNLFCFSFLCHPVFPPLGAIP